MLILVAQTLSLGEKGKQKNLKKDSRHVQCKNWGSFALISM